MNHVTTKTNASIPRKSKRETLDVFGYTSKGLPGLEFIGFGEVSQILKERVMFFLKQSRIKLPLKRYVIILGSGEGQNKTISLEDSKWLGLSLLATVLKLADYLPNTDIEKNIYCGEITLTGHIISPSGKNDIDLKKAKDYFSCLKEESA